MTDNISVSKKTTFNAAGEANELRLWFWMDQPNGGSADGKAETSTVAFGDAIPKPADPVKKGFAFTGWSPEVPATMPAQDMTFTAQFRELPRLRSVAASDVSLLYKKDGTIEPIVMADSGAKYTVSYSGFDSAIISVDRDGKVTALKKGATTVTVTVTDEFDNTAEATCTVTVTYAWWQILIRIFLLGFLWY